MRCSVKHKNCSPYHFDLVQGYRLWRSSWEEARENETKCYKAEGIIYDEGCPGPTFKNWLIQNKGRRHE